MTKTRFTLAALVMGGVLAMVVWQQRFASMLQQENHSLRLQLEQMNALNGDLSNRLGWLDPSLTAPRGVPFGGTNFSLGQDRDQATISRIAQMLKGDGPPELETGQLQRFLTENHRSAGSLLAAYRTSKDRALLQEAMQNYPGNPLVAFEAAFQPDLSAAERREWLEAFKKAAPDNSLGTYLSALDYFKSGQTELAVQELRVASGQPGFGDFTLERIQANEEAYRSVGLPEAEAKMAATWGVELPQLAQLKTLGRNLVDLAATCRQAGDPGSAQEALDMALALGQRVDAADGSWSPLISRLVGIAIERMALTAMEPSAEFGGGTVQDQIDRLARWKDSIKELVKHANTFQDRMTPEDWLNYNSRTLTFGEENAIGWLTNKYGPGQ
jgi:hypothetical protein